MIAFDKSEYAARMKKVQERMESTGIDVLIITDPANMCYLSGYDAWSFYTPQVLLVKLTSPQPVWIGRQQDILCAKETTWLDSDHILVYSDDHLWEPYTKHVMDYVAGYLIDQGMAKRTIGVESDAYYYTALFDEKLKSRLPDANFRDCSFLVNRIRMIKSDREIDYMKMAARIVEKGMQTAVDSIQVGTRECDAAAQIYGALLRGTDNYGGDYPAIVPLMPAGKRSAAPHLTWTDNKYEQQQLVYVEIAGCYKRYHAPLSRTIYLGAPPPEVKDTVEVIIEGLNAALEAIKPGETCESVEMAWKKVISKKGLAKESRMGYCVGLNYPPVWEERTAYLRPGDKTIFEPNMTFHVMPGMWFTDFGVAVTESIRVTESGCEPLADFPRKLFTS